MKAKTKIEAWEIANEIFPTDYAKDERASMAAGYEIYWSTAEGINAWISDLSDRIEINLPNRTSINIWIVEEPQFSEPQIEDALRVISEAIYEIDDNILPKLQEETGIDEARKMLYGAYAKIAKILKSQHPDSKLYDAWNLQDA